MLIESNEIKEFFNQREGWSLKELIGDLSYETKLLRSKEIDRYISNDEIGLLWGCEELTDLDTFIKEYTDLLLDKVVSVIVSFEEEE